MATDLGEIFREQAPRPQSVEAPAPAQHAPAEAPATAHEPESVSTQPKGEPVPAQAEQNAESAEARARNERGQFVPLPALQEERTKRQAEQTRARELEAELARLNGQIETLRQFVPAQHAQQQQSQHDPDAELNEFYLQPVEKMRSVMGKELEAAGEEFAREMHEDYDTVVAELAKAAKSSPHLVAQVMAQPPARRALAAYRLGKQYAQVAKFDSIEAMEKHFREDERAKVTEELRKANALAAADQIPKSVAAARGNGAETRPVWSGPKPLDRIFPGY